MRGWCGWWLRCGWRVSVSGALVILKNVREFSEGSAEFIVLEAARGASLAELHECHPELVPNPIVVNRWRRAVPQFDLLMKEAELAAADRMVWETIRIADDAERNAAQAKNAISARQWLAGKLADTFKQQSLLTVTAGKRLSDEELMQIASGGLPVIEGESERTETEGDGAA